MKTAWRFRLLSQEGLSVRNLPEAKEAIERLRQGRREESLPTAEHKSTLRAFATLYLASGRFLAKKPGMRQNKEQVVERWVAHCGGGDAAGAAGERKPAA